MRKMTWGEVCARRLARHSLVKQSTSMIDVAGRLCGVHAQVMSAAEPAIGLRIGEGLEGKPAMTIGTVTARSHR